VEIGNKTGGDMNQHERERQNRYRQRKKAAGYHRLEVWIPADVMKAIDTLHTEYGPFCRPQLALIELARRGLKMVPES
jgi:hypothetical protein